MIEECTPVLIVGAGPVGLALAGDLGWRGIDSILIEQGDGAITQPRMDMVGIRTMEFCRRWGIVDDVESSGYNRNYTQDCAWVTSLNGYEFGREPFPSPREEKAPPQSPQKRERCPQNFFDPVLRRFAESTHHVDLRHNSTLLDFEDLGDCVVARVQTPEGLTTIKAEYLVGADGGASRVREKLGITMSGEGVLTYTTNAIFRTDNLEALHHLEPAYRYIFIGPEGTWATLVAIDGRKNWRFSMVGDKEKRKISEEEMRCAIVRAVGVDFDFEILSTLPWIRRQLVADEYRRGRCFLVGDAAHLTSPTGGFGMNTGVLDAVNLSWKLAAAVQGWGGDALLDTYEAEQRPVAVRNVNEAGENLRRMLTPRVATPDPLIFSGEGPEAEQARREYGERYTEAMRREWFSIGVHLGYMYNSAIVIPDGTPAPVDEVSSYEPTARPGSRAPHFWLESGRSVLDEFGREYVLVSFAGADSAGLGDAFEAAKVPMRVLEVEDDAARELYAADLVLVRPDGQVAWRSNSLPEDPAELVDTVRGESRALISGS